MKSSSSGGPSRWPRRSAQVITDGLAREVRDPRIGFVTVTAVLVTGDLSHARVMVSVPGDDAEQARALEGLQSAAGFLRVARRADALDPDRAGAALRARPGPRARGPDQRAARGPPARGDQADRRAAGRQAGGPDVARRGAARPAGARTRAVGHTGHARPVRHRAAGGAGGPGDAAGAVRRGGRPRPISPPPGWASRPTPTTLTGTPLGPAARICRRLTRGRVAEALAGFAGEQRAAAAALLGQARGRRAELPAGAARASRSSRAETTVTVHADRAAWTWRRPTLVFRATVSAGTYVRALARDLGERLGVGAPPDRAPPGGDRGAPGGGRGAARRGSTPRRSRPARARAGPPARGRARRGRPSGGEPRAGGRRPRPAPAGDVALVHGGRAGRGGARRATAGSGRASCWRAP